MKHRTSTELPDGTLLETVREDEDYGSYVAKGECHYFVNGRAVKYWEILDRATSQYKVMEAYSDFEETEE